MFDPAGPNRRKPLDTFRVSIRYGRWRGRVAPYSTRHTRIYRHGRVRVHFLRRLPNRPLGIEALFKTEPHIATATDMGILPITDEFSLFARAGLAHWWYDLEFGEAGVGTVSFSEKSNELIWCAGTSLFFDRAILRLEYGQTKTSPDLGGTTFDLRLRVLTLSAVWML